MKRILKALWSIVKVISLWLYRVSGLEDVVSAIQSAAFRYKLRVRMVPVSYKLFIFFWGIMLGGSFVYIHDQAPELKNELVKASEPKVYINHAIAKEKPAEVKIEIVDEEWKNAEVSAYTASVDETDSSPLVMASGKMVYLGAVACPRNIELGTKIEIKGLGVYTCEDRMNKRYTNNFDIFMLTKSEAIKFGRKTFEWRLAQ